MTVAGTATIKVPGLFELGKGLSSVGDGVNTEVSIQEKESPEKSFSSNLKALGDLLSTTVASATHGKFWYT